MKAKQGKEFIFFYRNVKIYEQLTTDEFGLYVEQACVPYVELPGEEGAGPASGGGGGGYC